MTPSDNQHIIPATATLLEALKRMEEITDGVKTLILLDATKVAGTLTDGDIRRALLRGTSLEAPAFTAANPKFMAIAATGDDVEVIRDARSKGIKLLPVLDNEGQLVDILDLTKSDTRLPLSAILMAGGKGERLRPLTTDTPKPLLEIGGMPIIDYNIRALSRAGITDVTVTTRYLARKIHDHFSSPRFGIRVKCVEETQPLGTIGAASLVQRSNDGDTLVMNSDLLTTLSLEEMFLFHKRENADITIAAIPYTVSVPYAIMATDGRRVLELREKPTYSHYANAGIYIFSNRVLDTIPADTPTDAPDLITQAIGDGKRVVYFPIDGLWIDIGTPSDFRHASELMERHRSMKHL